MSRRWWSIEPLGRVIVRDGRPFGDGSQLEMHSLPWPMPGTLAGAVRAYVGRSRAPADEDPFGHGRAERLLKLSVHGPYLIERQSDGRYVMYWPAPRDVWVASSAGEGVTYVAGLRPCATGADEATDLTGDWAYPLPPRLDKPAPVPSWWSTEAYLRWLERDVSGLNTYHGLNVDRALAAYVLGEPEETAGNLADSWFRHPVPLEARTHVRIDKHGRATDGQLFTTSGLRLKPGQTVACLVQDDDGAWDVDAFKAGLSGFGGERGGAYFTPVTTPPRVHPGAWPRPSKGLRMVLVTPAIFRAGWLPGWLDETSRIGRIPGTDIQVQLVSAVLDRWRPVSGWDIRERRPKPMYKTVPAGSVYFFEVLDWGTSSWGDLWLRPVSDDEQHCRDGYGVAVFGVWNVNL
ncbi:MAG: type III-B CRISPR module-associated protein Cmr3 [Thermoflavifilum sp.]|nr:type III-B CRISPR module-associated protein Cmr3 [Thermoflavifilum sp.]MCL6515183.1 type III-B CRISPR module-associated protein Cmr3 [Alicyclobacillus sp.]